MVERWHSVTRTACHVGGTLAPGLLGSFPASGYFTRQNSLRSPRMGPPPPLGGILTPGSAAQSSSLEPLARQHPKQQLQAEPPGRPNRASAGTDSAAWPPQHPTPKFSFRRQILYIPVPEPGTHRTSIPPTGRAGGMGNIKTLGDTYQFAVDVSDFSPEDIIITASKNQIEVRAEKVSGCCWAAPSL